jgi:DNA-binding beta-propeller fold protein YncE
VSTIKKLIFSVLVISISIILYSCEDDCWPCPDCPEPEPVSDYDFYVSLVTPHKGLFVYNTKQRAVVDSVPALWSWSPQGMSVSAEGEEIIVSSFEPRDTLLVLNRTTYDTITTLPLSGYLELSNTGSYIAVQGDSLVFLDGETYAPIFSDTVEVESGRFIFGDTLFYCVRNYREILVYDMRGESLMTRFEYVDRWLNQDYRPSVYLLQPSPDGKIIYFLVAYTTSAYKNLNAYYVEHDSTTLRYPMGSGVGDMRLTPDGRQMLVTDPSNMFGDYASGNVISMNPNNATFIAITPPTWDPITAFEPCIIAITPDSKFALVGPGYYRISWKFGLIDLRTHEFVDVENFQIPLTTFFWVSCRKLP